MNYAQRLAGNKKQNKNTEIVSEKFQWIQNKYTVMHAVGRTLYFKQESIVGAAEIQKYFLGFLYSVI